MDYDLMVDSILDLSVDHIIPNLYSADELEALNKFAELSLEMEKQGMEKEAIGMGGVFPYIKGLLKKYWPAAVGIGGTAYAIGKGILGTAGTAAKIGLEGIKILGDVGLHAAPYALFGAPFLLGGLHHMSDKEIEDQKNKHTLKMEALRSQFKDFYLQDELSKAKKEKKKKDSLFI